MANSAAKIVKDALASLGIGKVYPVIAPLGVVRPYFTYQRVGGQSVNQLSDRVELKNARVQVNAWAETADQAMQMIAAAEEAICADPESALSLSEPDDTYESDTKLYGSRQDFSIWFTP